MKIAVPLHDGKLSAHFGHAATFALCDAEADGKRILSMEIATPPPHEPGVLPAWLRESGADVIIAGGMGQRAQQLFAEHGIEVVVGAPSLPPESVVQMYLDGTLEPGVNICDH